MIKKWVFGILFSIMSISAYSAIDDVFIGWSTSGVDTYSDGQTVLDGETYMLIYVKNGTEFKGLNSDGTLTDSESNEISMTLPVAKDGRCVPIFCSFSREYLSEHRDGKFILILLDTRVTSRKLSDVPRVNGWGFVMDINIGTDVNCRKKLPSVCEYSVSDPIEIIYEQDNEDDEDNEIQNESINEPENEMQRNTEVENSNSKSGNDNDLNAYDSSTTHQYTCMVFDGEELAGTIYAVIQKTDRNTGLMSAKLKIILPNHAVKKKVLGKVKLNKYGVAELDSKNNGLEISFDADNDELVGDVYIDGKTYVIIGTAKSLDSKKRIFTAGFGKCIGRWNVAILGKNSGYSVFVMRLVNSGRVSIKGYTANGNLISSVSYPMKYGERLSCVPAALAKRGDSICFVTRFDADGVYDVANCGKWTHANETIDDLDSYIVGKPDLTHAEFKRLSMYSDSTGIGTPKLTYNQTTGFIGGSVRVNGRKLKVRGVVIGKIGYCHAYDKIENTSICIEMR